MSTIRWLALTGAVVATMTMPSSAIGDDAPTFADRTDADVAESPRALGVMFNPVATASGVFGAEVDVAALQWLAVAVEGSVYRRYGAPGAAFGTGLLVYPLRSVFHALYVEPRVVFGRPTDESPLEVDFRTDAIGLGGTAGYQWTWDYGLAVRLGIGALYTVGASGRAPGDTVAMGKTKLVLDSSLGWAF